MTCFSHSSIMRIPENTTWLVFILDFIFIIVDNLTLLLFAAILIIGFFLTRKNRSLDAHTSVVLVWQSVAYSLTLTYIVGAIDYTFFESSCFGFGKNDFAIILIPGAICLLILGGSGFPKVISKMRRKGKNDGGDR